MNSFDLGAIFPDRSGHKLSRNVGAVSVYAFLKNSSWRTGPGMHPKIGGNFRKSDVCEVKLEFGRPCRGLSPGKGFAPNARMYYMTRRAFLSSRVIQAQGKFDSNMLVKNLESLVSKTKISENS